MGSYFDTFGYRFGLTLGFAHQGFSCSRTCTIPKIIHAEADIISTGGMNNNILFILLCFFLLIIYCSDWMWSFDKFTFYRVLVGHTKLSIGRLPLFLL